MRIHSFLPRSRANGPGLRSVLWLQGCTLACPGCFNPATHDPDAGREVDEASLARMIIDDHGAFVEGITISGGEPFFQENALEGFLAVIRAASSLSVLLFSGYGIDEIERKKHGPAVLSKTDILVEGRYERNRRLGKGLLGSSNQRIHLLSRRYTPFDLEDIADLEIQIDSEGTIILTGLAQDDQGWQ